MRRDDRPPAQRPGRIAPARAVAASDTVALTASNTALRVASSPMREVVAAADDDGSSALPGNPSMRCAVRVAAAARRARSARHSGLVFSM
jgi:hypothetical protein